MIYNSRYGQLIEPLFFIIFRIFVIKGGEDMPTISMFYGLIIRMYYAEHNPPHIHVYYQSEKAVINILDGTLIDGVLSKKHIRLIQAWVEIHKDELLADWDLCQNGEAPFKISPLR